MPSESSSEIEHDFDACDFFAAGVLLRFAQEGSVWPRQALPAVSVRCRSGCRLRQHLACFDMEVVAKGSECEHPSEKTSFLHWVGQIASTCQKQA